MEKNAALSFKCEEARKPNFQTEPKTFRKGNPGWPIVIYIDGQSFKICQYLIISVLIKKLKKLKIFLTTPFWLQ